MTTYKIGGNLIESNDQRLPDILAALHPKKARPLCMCQGDPGIPTYIAKTECGYIVKRMPNTGVKHAMACDSFEPPEGLSGLNQVMGSAIQEDMDHGTTTLKLDFSLSRKNKRQTTSTASDKSKDTVRTDGAKLSLKSLLHYLWEEAGFNRWSPAMAGKRNWNIIRHYLLQAAENKLAKGAPLLDILYIPETFRLDKKPEIEQRRIAWMTQHTAQGTQRPLMLLIGEINEISAARFGHKIVIKHAPDYHFMLPDDLHKRLLKHFAAEIELANEKNTKLIVIATFGVSQVGTATIEELALMNIDGNWLPFENLFEENLLNALAEQKRKFIKPLRYNLPRNKPLASAVVTDSPAGLAALYVVPPAADDDYDATLTGIIEDSETRTWLWRTGAEPIPALPA